MIVLYAIWAPVAWSLALVIQLALVIVCAPIGLFVPFERVQWIPCWLFGRIPYVTLSRMTVVWDPRFRRLRFLDRALGPKEPPQGSESFRGFLDVET